MPARQQHCSIDVHGSSGIIPTRAKYNGFKRLDAPFLSQIEVFFARLK
jgi:hypothetical protein